jgi:hypothetical protein
MGDAYPDDAGIKPVGQAPGLDNATLGRFSLATMENRSG